MRQSTDDAQVSSLRLPLTSPSTVNISRREAGVTCSELHINRRKFGGLSRAS